MNILLPTDFSSNSWNAILYAIEFYKTVECNFYILNVCIIDRFMADDAGAAGGGLVAGQIYQTDGLGAAPLNAAGIIMIKQ